MYASPAHLVADLGTQYIASNYVMPYLRGTLAKTNRRPRGVTSYRKPSLENKLRSLQRQVNQNKAATVDFGVNYTQIHTVAGYVQNLRYLSDDVVANADFREKINGEDFVNRYLKLNIAADPGFLQFRVVIYKSYQTDNIFQPGATQAGLTSIPSSKRHQVLYDGYMNLDSPSKGGVMVIHLPLKNLRTVLDETGDIEKGRITMTVISRSNGAATAQISGVMYCADK